MKICEKCGIMYAKDAVSCPKCGLSNSTKTKDETVAVFVDNNKKNQADTGIKNNDHININVKIPDSNKTISTYIDEDSNDNIQIFKKKEINQITVNKEEILVGANNVLQKDSENTIAEFVGNGGEKDNRTVAHFISETEETDINDIYIQGLHDEHNDNEILSIRNQNIISPAFSEEYEKRNINPYAVFVAIEGVNTGKVYVAYEGENTVGRSSDMSIIIEKDITVSRDSHCLIECKKDGNVILKSGKSKGITYLNSKPVFGESNLKDRDVVIIGKNKLMIIKICNDNFIWDIGAKS